MLRALRRALGARSLAAGSRGVRVEVMSHLGVVMTLALLVLVAAAQRNHELTLRDVLGRALLVESRAPAELSSRVDARTEWWLVGPGGAARPLGANHALPDARVLAIAEAARAQQAALLELGALWQPILFAAPSRSEVGVVVARLPDDASFALRTRSACIFAALAFADALVFGWFGFVLLRRRVVEPLERLAAVAREVGEVGEPVEIALEGPAETRALADAFHEMSASLAGRSKELGDAVVELREANERLRRTRAGLARAERLASVGRLAAGVAHEVGNPLGAILGFTEVVLKDPGLAPASRERLERTLREGERVRRILRQLLDLARPMRAESRPLDLARLGSDAKNLVAAQREHSSIVFAEEVGAARPLALGDEDAASQVLLNLLLNAAQAQAGASEPRILLRVRPCALGRREGDDEVGEPTRERADGVECLIADNGCGIAEEDRERVFDPFFSTRFAEGGTGLGLANALRLAEEQGGSLDLVPAPAGYRTAFAFRLPAVRTADAAVRASA